MAPVAIPSKAVFLASNFLLCRLILWWGFEVLVISDKCHVSGAGSQDLP